MKLMLPRASRQQYPTGFIEPCLPTLGHTVPSGPQWVHEIKHDGYRFICRRDGDRVRVFSRRGNDYAERVPAIAMALHALPVQSVTIDGEGVVCNGDGVSDFEMLRSELGRKGSRVPFLYAFDLLEVDGRDLHREPWHVRREILVRLLRGAGHGVQLSEHLATTDGNTIFRHACAMGLEGIVAKRRDRPYRSGRSTDWIKVKNPNAPAATRILEWLN
jgi:bifunctional non-homologous end joining protein LigD